MSYIDHIVFDETQQEIISRPIANSIADTYSSSKTYTIGDLVMYEGQLYRCKIAKNTGEWDSTKFEIYQIEDAIKDAVVVDNTLTIPGQAADAKKVGDEITGLKRAHMITLVGTEQNPLDLDTVTETGDYIIYSTSSIINGPEYYNKIGATLHVIIDDEKLLYQEFTITSSGTKFIRWLFWNAQSQSYNHNDWNLITQPDLIDTVTHDGLISVDYTNNRIVINASKLSGDITFKAYKDKVNKSEYIITGPVYISLSAFNNLWENITELELYFNLFDENQRFVVVALDSGINNTLLTKIRKERYAWKRVTGFNVIYSGTAINKNLKYGLFPEERNNQEMIVLEGDENSPVDINKILYPGRYLIYNTSKSIHALDDIENGYILDVHIDRIKGLVSQNLYYNSAGIMASRWLSFGLWNQSYPDPDPATWKTYSSDDRMGKKTLRILFVGNSLTQDAIAYLPYLLKTLVPDVEFKIYIWYNGGKTLEQQYGYFQNNTVCQIFSRAENTFSWTSQNNSVRMSDILNTYQFDVVCMQEYLNEKESFTETDLQWWRKCQDYIINNYTGGNTLEFVSLFHAPRVQTYSGDDMWNNGKYKQIFELTKTANRLILKNEVAMSIIPTGLARYLAFDTELDNLGDKGHLTADGTHAQEGLPCLLEAYGALLWAFDRLGIKESILNDGIKITNDIYTSINVPGPNLGTGLIIGTDAQNVLAQKTAIKAYKESKELFNAPRNVVRFDEAQSLTNAQKTQAKTNIGVPSIDTTLSITGAAADAKKVGDEISDLKSNLSEVKDIPTGSDLNNYHTPGMYCIQSGSTILNFPEDTVSRCTVFVQTEPNGRTLQTLKILGTLGSREYGRWGFTDSTWSEWGEFVPKTYKDVVRFDVIQNKTDEEKAIARENIGVANNVLSDDTKATLMRCFWDVAWAIGDGIDRYNDLYKAIYDLNTLVNINDFNLGVGSYSSNTVIITENDKFVCADVSSFEFKVGDIVAIDGIKSPHKFAIGTNNISTSPNNRYYERDFMRAPYVALPNDISGLKLINISKSGAVIATEDIDFYKSSLKIKRPKEVILGEVTTFSIGSGAYENNAITIYQNTKRLTIDIHKFPFEVGDIIDIDNNGGVYKFNLGTNNVSTSPNNRYYVKTNYISDPYTVIQEDIAELKLISVLKTAGTDFTENDVNFLKASMKIINV